MSIENLIADAVERGVLAAMTKLNATQLSSAEVVATVAVPGEAPAVKKSGRPKKVETAAAPADAAPVVTETPLPTPAAAPAVAQVDDIESDRAKLIMLTSKIENGRKVATELIRQHGPKFDALAGDVRAAILAQLEAMVPA
jgi:pyruvate/2-oxoglutarate dehydrogenase complex dihydrolipoamide acyltransferase (E2) component